MTLLNWLADNWFVLLQGVGIVGGLIYTGSALRSDAKARQVQNLFALTKQHREIWSMLFERPELSRVLESALDLATAPITREEELFVSFLIFHLNNSYRATQAGLFIGPERLREDIRGFFSLPIPQAVWKKTVPLQDRDFALFVESCGQQT
jgi:hypothetical protein